MPECPKTHLVDGINKHEHEHEHEHTSELSIPMLALLTFRAHDSGACNTANGQSRAIKITFKKLIWPKDIPEHFACVL